MGVTGTRIVNDDLHSNKNGNKNVVWRKKTIHFWWYLGWIYNPTGGGKGGGVIQKDINHYIVWVVAKPKVTFNVFAKNFKKTYLDVSGSPDVNSRNTDR